jgi:hypothetical protein
MFQGRVSLKPPSGLVAIHHGELDIHQDEIWLAFGCLCETRSPVMRLEKLVAHRFKQIPDDLPVVLGVLDQQNPLGHAASNCSAGITGSQIRKVDPEPTSELTVIVPPCISTMRLDIASPRPEPPLCRVLLSSTC